MKPSPRELALRSTLTLVALLATVTLPLSAQRSGTTIGIGVGPIAAYPNEFEAGGCDGEYLGFNVGARRPISSLVAIGGSLDWTGSVTTTCALANDALSRPAPLDGDSYRRTSIPPEIPNGTFWGTRLGVVVTPSVGPLTPLLRVTGGRLWSKDLWTWTVGAGLRYGFGRQAVVLDVERWNLAYDVTQETWIYRESATDELESSEVVERRPRPWFVRLGWELTVGK